jgi:hypothetical protein
MTPLGAAVLIVFFTHHINHLFFLPMESNLTTKAPSLSERGLLAEFTLPTKPGLHTLNRRKRYAPKDLPTPPMPVRQLHIPLHQELSLYFLHQLRLGCFGQIGKINFNIFFLDDAFNLVIVVCHTYDLFSGQRNLQNLFCSFCVDYFRHKITPQNLQILYFNDTFGILSGKIKKDS